MNTNFMSGSTACAGAGNAGCQAWEQFVYFTNGTSGSLFIQYWLLKYNASCPSGWNQLLLSACGGPAQSGIPKKPFRPRDVGPEAYQRARATCVAAGVKQGPHMDACTIDVAFTGNAIAANAFVNVPAPVAVGRFR